MTGVAASRSMACRTALRSGASSLRVELTNTRSRWSGVRIFDAVVTTDAPDSQGVHRAGPPFDGSHVTSLCEAPPTRLGSALQERELAPDVRASTCLPPLPRRRGVEERRFGHQVA